MSKTILVTGGAGFIGSNFVAKILASQKGTKVVCVDNLDPTYDVAFKRANLKRLSKNRNFRFYQEDIVNKSKLTSIFKKEKPEIVVHLAAKADTRRSVADPLSYYQTNILGTLNLLELAKDFGVKNFVFISSSSVYGNDAKTPFREDFSVSKPLSPYGATKRAGELLCYSYFYNFSLPITCLRIFNAYGEYNRPDLVIYKWVENILRGKPIEISGGGTRERDFTYVGDVIEAIIKAVKYSKGFEIINIGNSKPISLKKLLAKIEKVVGKKAVVNSRSSARASVESTCADVSKAKKVLNWSPKVSMDQGLARFVTWFKAERLK